MASMNKTPSDYDGQPRSKNGRFGRGKQNGSRSKGRNLGAKPGKDLAGLFSLPPVRSGLPNFKPGEKPTIGA
jgi:hypothetical protein